MTEANKLARFEQLVMPHLDAAHNLARWLLRNGPDAEDIVQEACLRAFHFFGTFQGESGRPWLLAIVRNTCYTWLQKNRKLESADEFDEQVHSPVPETVADPEAWMVQQASRDAIRKALEDLPVEYREVITLRELEGLSYREIAEVAGVRIGTVMSRLARARKRLGQSLAAVVKKESSGGM